MNYRKNLLITLLSVSVLGTATTATAFADQQSDKANVTQPSKTTITTTDSSKASVKAPTVKSAEPAKQVVKAATQKVAITLNPYVVGRDLHITGSYNGTNAVYMRAEVNGQKKALVSSKELASGKISYYVGNLQATDKAEIVLFNKDYQEIGRQQVSITEPVKTVITLDKYVVGKSSTISGTYNGTNAVYMRAEINGKKDALVSSKELASGKINYYVGKLNTGDKADIVLFDKNYQEIGRQQVTIDGPAQVSMKLDNYTIGRSTHITGTYSGTDAKYMRAEVNGKKEALVQSKELASGKINYYVGNLKAGDQATIVLFNANYEEIGRQQVTLTEPTPIKFNLDNYVLGQSNRITGTYDGTNAVYMQAVVNGKKEALASSKELASGKINYYVGDLKETDKAEIVLFDKNYQEIGRQQVNIVKPVKVNMTINNYDIGKSTAITGTYDGTNAVYMQAVVNGKAGEMQTSKDLETGKINYNLSGLKQQDNVEIVLYNKGHQEIGRQAVPFSVNQSFYLAGSGDYNRLLVSAENQKVTIQGALKPYTSGQTNSNFGSQFYFSIGIKNPQGQWITHLNWEGQDWINGDQSYGTFNVPNGSTVQIAHREASTRLNTNDNAALKTSNGVTYTYRMENNRLVLISVSPDYLL